MTIDAAFHPYITTTVMDRIFELADDDTKWGLWLAATVCPAYDWVSISKHIADIRDVDMESFVAAIVSEREALAGRLAWIPGSAA